MLNFSCKNIFFSIINLKNEFPVLKLVELEILHDVLFWLDAKITKLLPAAILDFSKRSIVETPH